MSVDNKVPGKTPDANEYDRAWLGMLAALTGAGYLKVQAVVELLEEAEKTDELPSMPVNTARAALNWLMMNGYTDAQTEHVATEQLLEQLRTCTVPAHVRSDMSALATLDPRFDDAMRQHDKLAMRRFKRWAALGSVGAAVVIGGIVLWTMFPFTPACDARDTRRTLSAIGIGTAMQVSLDSLKFTRKPPAGHLVSFSDETEVGYDEQTGSRACTAKLIVDGKDLGEKTGYVVERVPGSRRDFRVRTMPVEFVMASYTGSALDKKLGAPVGRDAMRAAMVAALHRLDGPLAARAPSSDEPRWRGGDSPKSMADSVQNVLPTADCRALDSGRYACPVQVEFRDGLLDVLGAMPYRLLKGEFVFERDGSGWKVADGFYEAFAKSLVSSRFGIDNEANAATHPEQGQ
jgi:hypothetical protein